MKKHTSTDKPAPRRHRQKQGMIKTDLQNEADFNPISQQTPFSKELRIKGFIPLWEQLALREKMHEMSNIDKTLLLADIRRGLEAREFLYFYQPQWDLKTGKIEALESSLRWYHPQKGLLGTEYFMSVFEEAGLLRELTNLLFEQLFEDRAQLELNGFNNYKIAVKLSLKQLEINGLADELTDLLTRLNIPPQQIECELSERQFSHNARNMRTNLQQFHETGISLSIDKFGSGFSAYPYLSEFPFQKIKLEKNYTTDMAQNPRGQLIIQSVINLAHLLNAVAVVDGIDSMSVVRWLNMMGCDLGQGCFLGGPMKLEYLVDFLKEYRKIADNGKKAIEDFWLLHAKQASRYSPDCPSN